MRSHALEREKKTNLIAELIVFVQEIPTDKDKNKLEGIKIGKRFGRLTSFMRRIMIQIKKKEEARIHFKFIVRLMIYEVDYNCINNCKVCCYNDIS